MPLDSPSTPWSVDNTEASKRLDLRQSEEHLIYSIDPPGCEDVDDALCVRELPSGDVELSVHIADVSHFVTSGSAVDAAAAARCTTVYLCDNRYDMLPEVLSGRVCSLWADVDR